MKINRTNDYVFAKIFGDPQHKEIALSLINAVFEFEGTDLLEDIDFIDRTLLPNYPDEKLSRLDILGRSQKGERVNIEMQVANEHNMERRTLYYWSKLYSTLEKGKEYDDLTRTVTINLLNYNFLPNEDFHSMYRLYNLKNKHLLTGDLEIHFIEMQKWKYENPKEMKRLDRWLAYFTDKITSEEMEAIAMMEPTIQKAIEIESVFTKDEILRREYEQREKAIMDYTSAMNAAQRIGHSIGREEGREEGHMEVALSMLKEKLPIELICQCTNLSEKEIRSLKKQN